MDLPGKHTAVMAEQHQVCLPYSLKRVRHCYIKDIFYSLYML